MSDLTVHVPEPKWRYEGHPAWLQFLYQVSGEILLLSSLNPRFIHPGNLALGFNCAAPPCTDLNERKQMVVCGVDVLSCWALLCSFARGSVYDGVPEPTGQVAPVAGDAPRSAAAPEQPRVWDVN